MNAMAGQNVKKIGIIGLGPVGMILAASLRKNGHNVFLCDTDIIKIDLIRNEGISVENHIDEKIFFPDIYTSLEDLIGQEPEIIFLAVKTPHLAAVAQQLRKAGGEHIPLVCAMNGIDVEQILTKEVGETRVLRMVVNFAGNLNAPNIARRTFFNPPNYIASVDDSARLLAVNISDLLTKAGLQTTFVTSFEMLHRVWEKTILNASLSPLCAVGRMTIREAMSLPDTVEVIEQVIEEAVEVAEAEKIRFPDDFVRNCLRYLKRAGDHFPSLAVDLLNNRPTEIDHMNGKIVEYGRKHYVRTSLNLAFTNMVRAITHKHNVQTINAVTKTALRDIRTGTDVKHNGQLRGDCFLGVDLGSAYTKFTVINTMAETIFRTTIKTHNRDRISIRHVLSGIRAEFNIASSCSTGYGRKHFSDPDIIKTELNCAAKAVAAFYPGEYNIVDIGGEDIKIIRTDKKGSITSFYLNDKCAAGTGAFITEIAEKAGIPVLEMSSLAAKSTFKQELNSFCTVFAKTEIMAWLFDGLAVEDISRGIYHSIINRVAKMKIDPSVPVLMIGGVISVHPYLAKMLGERISQEVMVIEHPHHLVSLGAAMYAREEFLSRNEINVNEHDKANKI